jgi:hypothetical protein
MRRASNTEDLNEENRMSAGWEGSVTRSGGVSDGGHIEDELVEGDIE